MSMAQFGNNNARKNFKAGEPVTKALYEKTLKRITLWDNYFDANHLPPRYNLRDYKQELSELHAIVRTYQDQNEIERN